MSNADRHACRPNAWIYTPFKHRVAAATRSAEDMRGCRRAEHAPKLEDGCRQASAVEDATRPARSVTDGAHCDADDERPFMQGCTKADHKIPHAYVRAILDGPAPRTSAGCYYVCRRADIYLQRCRRTTSAENYAAGLPSTLAPTIDDDATAAP
jgi:hypothetical protein